MTSFEMWQTSIKASKVVVGTCFCPSWILLLLSSEALNMCCWYIGPCMKVSFGFSFEHSFRRKRWPDFLPYCSHLHWSINFTLFLDLRKQLSIDLYTSALVWIGNFIARIYTHRVNKFNSKQAASWLQKLMSILNSTWIAGNGHWKVFRCISALILCYNKGRTGEILEKICKF